MSCSTRELLADHLIPDPCRQCSSVVRFSLFRSPRCRRSRRSFPTPSLGLPPHPKSSQNGVGFSIFSRCDNRGPRTAPLLRGLEWDDRLRRPSLATAPQTRLVSLSPFRRVHPVHIRRRLPENWGRIL